MARGVAEGTERFTPKAPGRIGKSRAVGAQIFFSAPSREPNFSVADDCLQFGGFGGTPPAQAENKETIYGNRIRVRIVKAGYACAPKRVGFVYNPDPNAVGTVEVLNEEISARSRFHRPQRRVHRGDRQETLRRRGADSSDNAEGSSESYTPVKNAWKTLAAIPQPVASPGSVVYKGQLYCFGGGSVGTQFQGTLYDTVQIYQH